MRKTAAKQFAILLSVAAIGAAQLTTVALGDVFTEPVGFYKVDLLTNSDTYTSIPFTRMPEYVGAVASVAGNVITVNGTPGWTANQWATPTPNKYLPYYARLETGTKVGGFYTITNNTASTLSVILAPEDLSGVASNDRVRIIPYWTLSTVFPGGTGVVVTTSTLAKKTEILFPNLAGVGINLAASASYFYYNNNWRRTIPSASVLSNFNDVVILPDQYIFARQSSAAPTSTYLAPGLVMTNNNRIPLYANVSPSGLKQDNYLSIYRPAVQTLYQSGLSNVIKKTTSTLAKQDEVLFFNNAVQQKNKPASFTYFFYNNGWRRTIPSAALTIDYGNSNVFNPGEGFIVRRATNTSSTVLWSNPANY